MSSHHFRTVRAVVSVPIWFSPPFRPGLTPAWRQTRATLSQAKFGSSPIPANLLTTNTAVALAPSLATEFLGLPDRLTGLSNGETFPSFKLMSEDRRSLIGR